MLEDIPPPPSSDSLPPPPPSDPVPPPPPDVFSSIPPAPPTSDAPPPPPEPAAVKKKFVPIPKKTPPSIEDIIKKKREADELAAKPRFIPKKERERIALEKREKEVAEQKKREGERRAEHQRWVASAGSHRKQNGTYQNGHSAPPAIPTGPRSLRPGEVPTGPASMRATNGHDMGPPAQPASATTKTAKTGDKRPSPAELEAAQLRQRYMGADQNQSTFSAKKKRRRTTEKKFNFEWNAEEDTSLDTNPIYAERIETNFYGRGHFGGLDGDSKLLAVAKSIEERDPIDGKRRAQELLDMERQRKAGSRRAALDMHWTEKKLEDMRERDWRIFKEDFSISTKGGSLPNPMRGWNESGLPPQLLKTVEEVGYMEPSAVQRAAIPIALKNRDLIGIAVTGSGKTAAFLLPLLTYIMQLPPLDEGNKQDGPYAVILAPTRELAQQIELETRKFATPLGFKCVSIVGGHSIEEQVNELQKGAEVVIATPGRLVDCIERRVLMLNQCCYIIMDEADRMIDLGFEESVNKILDALPVKNAKPDTVDAENPKAMSTHLGNNLRYRQTMMYTATMPSAVERIARKYLIHPATVTIGNAGEAVETVEQRVEFVSGEDKRKKRLKEILDTGEFAPPIIVFVNIKRNCDAIARDIKHMGYSSVTLHGSKTQDQREAALASIRNGSTDVLVATDLAGRGIDVLDVSLVVNFNMATNIESYTHRIGRTGRAGKHGVAITFLGNEDAETMYDLKQMLTKSEISRVPEELKKHESAQQKPSRGGGGKKIEESSGFAGKGGGGGGGW